MNANATHYAISNRREHRRYQSSVPVSLSLLGVERARALLAWHKTGLRLETTLDAVLANRLEEFSRVIEAIMFPD